MLFRKKPLIVDAVQWFPDAGIYHRGIYVDQEGSDRRPYVVTIHHERAHLEPGDWILPEPDGRSFYPCKPDIFAATYEPVDASDDPPTRVAGPRSTVNGGVRG